MSENISSKKISLVLEACNGKALSLAKVDGSALREIATESSHFQAENIAQFFFDALAKNKINIEKVESIGVCIGPGSYIATRAAAILANLLANEHAITLKAFGHQEGFTKAVIVTEIEPHYH